MSQLQNIRRSAMLAAGGLVIQLFASVFFSPWSFVMAAALGLPLVLCGAGMFLIAIWRVLRERGAL
jgi:hypothetical protein